MLSRLGVVFMHVLNVLPLGLIRAMGWGLGMVLYGLAVSRRRSALKNLTLAFPELSPAQRAALARTHFVYFGQAWLDRSWLWHGNPATTRRRLHLTGEHLALTGSQPLVIFAPHFVGLDAGWTALTQAVPRKFATIYMPLENLVVDEWVQKGRMRFGEVLMFPRSQGVRQIAQDIGSGALLYLLPDLDYGTSGSEFIEFFGTPAATATSLSRFCRVARAQTVTVTSLISPTGYDIHVSAPWAGFPTADVTADTRAMNVQLEALIREQPAQYLWTHRRYKTRPPGSASLY